MGGPGPNVGPRPRAGQPGRHRQATLRPARTADAKSVTSLAAIPAGWCLARAQAAMMHLAWWPFIVLAGAAVGLCTGLFGVGGSSVATPVLALLGAPELIAVASPLPATIPSAAVGAVPYLRSGEARPRAAAWSVLGGVPGTISGALLSRLADGQALLVASGIVLVGVGLLVIRPIDEASVAKGAERRRHRGLLAAAMFATGVFTGLLANGGGFLTVPSTCCCSAWPCGRRSAPACW
jgi:uncharacterized membrane protein YfcA